MIPAERLAELIDHPDEAVRVQALELLACWGEVPWRVEGIIRFMGVPCFMCSREAAPGQARLQRLLQADLKAWRVCLDAGRKYATDVGTLRLLRAEEDAYRQYEQAIHKLDILSPARRELVRMHLEAALRWKQGSDGFHDLVRFLLALLPERRNRAALTAARWLLQHVGAKEAER